MDTLSLKGMVTNGIPLLLLSVLILLAMRAPQAAPRYFHQADVSCVVVLLTLACVADTSYNVGRLVMHTFPLFLPAVAGFIDAELNQQRLGGHAGDYRRRRG